MRNEKQVNYQLVDRGQEDTSQFQAVVRKATELGVLGIELEGEQTNDTLNRTLNIIESNKQVLDRNAGEVE